MIAITRDVSRTIQQAELTHLEPQRIDFVLAGHQHDQYRLLLESLGCEVVKLPADDRYPDCVFIEDTAIVFEDLAVITRPGAESRRGETRVVADALEQYRPLVHIEAPATIDGGDVLVLDERLYVGLSERTNEAAIAQLRFHTRREVIPVRVDGCLHLKTGVTRVSRDTLLINRNCVDETAFTGWSFIDVDPSEPFVEAARERQPGVGVQRAAAEELPFDDRAFDAALAQLVVHFMADPVAGLREMGRVTRKDGVVAACVWDHTGDQGPLSLFWRAARELDPDVVGESQLAGAREGHLGELFRTAGLNEIEESALSVSVEHPGFEEWWEPFTLGVGPAGGYAVGLDAKRQAELRERCRAVLPGPPFRVTALAWAARAFV